MRRKILFLILIITFISGCVSTTRTNRGLATISYSSTPPILEKAISKSTSTPTSLPSPQETSTLKPSPSKTLIPSITPKPTRTTTPTVTIVPTPKLVDFPTPIPGNVIRQQCLTFQGSLQAGSYLDGKVILGTDPLGRYGKDGQAYLTDMQSGITRLALDTEIKGDFVPTIHRISPDKKWYFYFSASADGKGSQLHIRSIKGQELPVVYWDSKWPKSAEWLDNQHILIRIRVEEWDNYGAGILLNPFSGEWQKLTADKHVASNLSITAPIIHYNPTLTQVIYQSGDSILIMRDIQSIQDIWLKRGVNFLVPPSWSPDGSQFAFVVTDLSIRQSDIYLVKPDGQETQLTHLADVYPSVSEIYIEDMEWSPDGRYVAFSVFVKDNGLLIKGPTLMIVDVASQQIIDTCVVVSQYSGGYLVWSPASNLLVVASPIDYLEYLETAPKGVKPHARILLVDIMKGLAYPIAEDMAPMGWMLSP